MKKIYNILFVIALFMTFSLSVKAEDDYKPNSFTCNYRGEITKGGSSNGEGTMDASFTVDTVNKTITINDYNDRDVEIIDPKINPNYTIEKLIEDDLHSRYCPDYVYVAYYKKKGTTKDAYAVIINTGLQNQVKLEADEKGQYYIDGNKEHYINISEGYLVVGSRIDGPELPSDLKPAGQCMKYEELMGEIKKYNTPECMNDEKCNLEKIENYSNIKNELNVFCDDQSKHGNYLDVCVWACEGLSYDINKIEGTKAGECGFSDRLIAFIVNILKWIKYLVPALIIILSIIDFMKAIGADKDDEMKKAQQKFMKRLIIAALIFIVPFILEFVITKMGFNYNSCGIF